VLAWGNSLGDLAADFMLSKSGNPQMAAAGVFGAPLFNFMIGLGLAFMFLNIKMYPEPYVFPQTIGMEAAFIFLLSLLSFTLVAIPLSGFEFRRPFALVLTMSYLIFVTFCVLIEIRVIH